MRRDPTPELLQAMAECGLHPRQIIWDGAFHRFPGVEQQKGDNGWYGAFADQRGAIFGDWRTKEQWRWPQDNPAWRESMKHLEPLSAEEVRKREAAAAQDRAAKAAKHSKQIRNLWQRAKPVQERGHPYLDGKGIRNVPLLRSIIDPETEQEMLLIPMFHKDGEIRNIQRIWPDGTRLQMKQAAGSRGLYHTIGAQRYMQSKTLYICEGWATGWTIHKASGCAVIVAFFDGGLLTVGKIIQEKYPEARLVIAADNDRWKPVMRKGKNVNPGVYAARKAAEELEADLCIPDFKDLSDVPEGGKGPTDYDDLRQREGLDAVRTWLKPKNAERAVTIAPWNKPQPPAQPELGPKQPEDDGKPPERNAPGHDPPEQRPEPRSPQTPQAPDVHGDSLEGLMPEMSKLAQDVSDEGWTPALLERLAEIRSVARDLDVDGPPPLIVDGKSPRDALAELEAHAKAHGPSPKDRSFEADGSPRGLLMGDDWSKEVPPVSWAVEKWATAGTVLYLAGRGATGKTPLATQLALAVASGKSEFIPVAHDDSEAPQIARGSKPRTAVFIGWESTAEDMMRIRVAIEKCGGPKPEDIGRRFKFLPAGQREIGPIWAPRQDGSGHVATRAGPTPNGERLMAWLNTIPDLGLVVFDPIASCYASDENSRALVREFLDWLAAFAANHVGRPLVVLVGHPAKASVGEASLYSGTTDWRNACRAMWVLQRRTASGFKKREEGTTRDYMSVTLNKLNAPGRQPIEIPLASLRAPEGLGWRWKEAASVADAVASYAAVLGLDPAGQQSASDEPRPPSKTEKNLRYVSERIVNQKGVSIPLADVQDDYDAWHSATYDTACDGLLGKRAFNKLMKGKGKTPRMGERDGVVDRLNNAAFKEADN